MGDTDGVTHCAIEASSIGLAEHRLAGTRIQLAVFTNFTQDHLDYHGSMSAYWQAKEALFAWPDLQVAVDQCRRCSRARKLAKQLQNNLLNALNKALDTLDLLKPRSNLRVCKR